MKTRKNLFKLLATAIALTLMLGVIAAFGLVAGAQESADGSDDVAYIVLQTGQSLSIYPTYYRIAGGDEIAHTGAYVISGSTNAEISFCHDGEERVEYDVTFHNVTAISQTWYGCMGVGHGVTVNMTVIGVNRFVAYNHPGIAAGGGNSALDRIINLTVAENSSVEFNANWVNQDVKGMADGITLNILSGECSEDMTVAGWNKNGFTVSSGAPVGHTNSVYTQTENGCFATCADCSIMLSSEVQHDMIVGANDDGSTHSNKCAKCGYSTDSAPHSYEYVYVSGEECAPKCTACGYINADETKEHSFVDRVCEYCGTVQLIKVQNGETETFYSSWYKMIAYINENDNCTVTLLQDVVMDNETWIRNNLTIDLAGHKLSDFCISGSGEVQIRFIDSSEDKTGEVLKRIGRYCFTAYDNSTIIIDGIITDGSFCINFEGSVIINDMVATSSFTELYIEDGSLTVNGGDFNEVRIDFSSRYTEESTISVKNITCENYIVRGLEDKTIADTLAEGYTLTYANGDFVDVSLREVSGEISAVEHTHEYAYFLNDETNHWTGCACGAMTPDTSPEEHTGSEATCTTPKICNVCGATVSAALGHDLADADCTTPKTCNVCGATEGEALGHDWADADCTTPKTCNLCGITEGEALGHDWADADCTTPKTCEACGETEGEALGHDWADADCTNPKTCEACGETEGEALGHDWADADCTTPKTCEACGETEGEALGHDWADADCTTPKTCEACGETEGEALGHDWVDADCTTPKTCEACGETEGNALGHDWADADCTTPKTCEACGETEGEALGHKYDSDTDAECNECGSKRDVEQPTEPSTEPSTEAPADNGGDDEEEKSGCSSAIGISLIGLATALSAGFVLSKKRR